MSVKNPSRAEVADMPVLSRGTRRLAGVLLLIMVTVELGGYVLTWLDTGKVQQTAFPQNFERAGHAPAGVLLILSLVVLVLTDAARLTGWFDVLARLAIPAAAVLIAAGLFLLAIGTGRTQPNPLVVLLWLGLDALTAGLVSFAVALLRR